MCKEEKKKKRETSDDNRRFVEVAFSVGRKSKEELISGRESSFWFPAILL